MPSQVGVPLPLRMHPGTERVQYLGRGPSNLGGLGQLAHSVQKAADCGFGGDAAALGAADSVGNGGNDVPARFG